MRFIYVAQDKENQIQRGTVDAPTRENALALILARGLDPIKIDSAQAEENKSRRGSLKALQLPHFLQGSLTTFDQIMIVRHLGIILTTGTDLLSGLEILARDSIKPIVKQIIYDVKERVARGEKFSDALSVWGHHFNPVLINLVKSGEVSGNLPSILVSYAQELKKDYAFVRKLKGALFYPAILMSALFGMVIMILSFVAPRLNELFSSLKTQPPFYIKVLFGLSNLWTSHTLLFSILFIIFIIAIIIAIRKRNVRLKLALLLRFIPFLNKLQKNITLMRFSKTIANLITAGFSLKAAMMTTSEIIDVRYQKIVIDIAQKSLEQGLSLTDAMKKYPDFFPDILISAVSTGEKSGKLSPVLEQMAEFYEEEIIYNLETFLTLLEPALLVIVGIVVGLLAGALISPIYRLIGKF